MDNNEWVECNHEFGFLYKQCKNVSGFAITLIANVPEFMEEIRKNLDKTFDEQVLYDILKPKANEMLKIRKLPRHGKNAMKILSKVVTGDSQSWRNP